MFKRVEKISLKSKAGNFFGFASLILGILSIVSFIFCMYTIDMDLEVLLAPLVNQVDNISSFSYYLSFILSFLSIIFASVQDRKSPNRIASVGLILGTIVLCLSTIIMSFLVFRYGYSPGFP